MNSPSNKRFFIVAAGCFLLLLLPSVFGSLLAHSVTGLSDRWGDFFLPFGFIMQSLIGVFASLILGTFCGLLAAPPESRGKILTGLAIGTGVLASVVVLMKAR
jgi:hypothetical protein